MNDYILNQYAKECAAEIIAEFRENHVSAGETLADYRDEMGDQAHEYADGSEHVIYHAKAHAICQNCNTDEGEAFLEETGNPENPTYDSLATVIAYGELRFRIERALGELIEEVEKVGDDYENLVGYNPFVDDPKASLPEIKAALAELHELHKHA